MKESLNDAEVALMAVYRDKWINRVTSCQNRTIQSEAVKGVNFIYELMSLPPPIVHFVDSPGAAQAKARELTGKNEYFQPAGYGSIGNYSWVAYYDYFREVTDEGKPIVQHENFNRFVELMEANVFDMIMFETDCICTDMPSLLKYNNQGELHCTSGPAVEFYDGQKMYFWNGVGVPEAWILDPVGSITNEVVRKEENAEMRRVHREILGGLAYYTVLANGHELRVIDTDTDHQGYPMTLYRVYDEVVERDLEFLQVTCPSSDHLDEPREYTLYPPKQEGGVYCSNVWEAKASTFSDEKISIRQGDVGLVDLDAENPPEFPIFES